MTSVSRSTDVPHKPSASPTLKQIYHNFKQSEKQITSFTPLRVATSKDNFTLSKNFITQYDQGTDGERATQLFIKGYRIVAGCVIVNKKTQKVMLITYGNSHHYHFPKGGVENDEIRYKQGKTANYEDIPGVEYSFMESALRETWEEAGVKGRVVKDLGKYYYYNDSVITDEIHQWVNKKPKKFPKSVEYYYEMEVNEVCDLWPDGESRPRKWFDISDCLDELVSNGRFAQFKAVLECSLVGDKHEVYRTQFSRDQLAWESKQEFWPRMYNSKYTKVFEEYSGAEVYVSIIVYNEKGEIMISSVEYGIGGDKVRIEHEPFTWRSSKRFGSCLRYGKMVAVSGYESKNKVKSGVFDMGRYTKCVHVYSAMVCGGEGKWMTVDQWKEKYKDGSEIFQILSDAVDCGRVEHWSKMRKTETDIMQGEIDRLKGELTKTKNELAGVSIRLSKRR